MEIPAVPEDREILAGLLPRLAGLGVKHLNLHQLRITPYSLPRFLGRPYTYLHGPKVTVLESELMALELLQKTAENKLDLAVNYCSFIYKHRYQARGARLRAARQLVKPYEQVTPAGYIRALSLHGTVAQVAAVTASFTRAGISPETWKAVSEGTVLVLHPCLLPLVPAGRPDLRVGYWRAELRSAASARHYFREVPLASGREIIVEKIPALKEKGLTPDEVQVLEGRWLRGGGSPAASLPDSLADIARFEEMETGLYPYF